MFGSNWKTVLNNTFGGEASELGARSKSVVKSINKTEQYNSTFYNIFFMMYLGIGVVEACNITTDYWDFTTGDFNSTPDQESASAYSIKDPEKLNEMCASYYFLAADKNVTIARMAIHFAQLPANPSGYLNEINWSRDLGFSAQGSKVVHNINNAPWMNAGGVTYQQNGTETWSYYSNGALISYELKDNQSNTIYKYEIDLSGLGIPGFELPVLLGVTGLSLIGLIYIFRKKN